MQLIVLFSLVVDRQVIGGAEIARRDQVFRQIAKSSKRFSWLVHL